MYSTKLQYPSDSCEIAYLGVAKNPEALPLCSLPADLFRKRFRVEQRRLLIAIINIGFSCVICSYVQMHRFGAVPVPRSRYYIKTLAQIRPDRDIVSRLTAPRQVYYNEDTGSF